MDKNKVLTREEINEKLASLPGWVVEDQKIKKEFKFKGFLDGIDFVVQTSYKFEELGHHPEILILYNKIVFYLQTHEAVNKITNLDFLTAREIQNGYDLKLNKDLL